MPPLTTFGSLFAKAAEMKNRPPFDLPAFVGETAKQHSISRRR